MTEDNGYTGRDEDMDMQDPDMDCKKSTPLSIPLSSLEGRLLVVRVGDDHRPAGPEDIKKMELSMKKLLKGVNCKLLVTHHSVSFEIM